MVFVKSVMPNPQVMASGQCFGWKKYTQIYGVLGEFDKCSNFCSIQR